MLDVVAWQSLAQNLMGERSGAVVVLAVPTGQVLAQVGRCDEAKAPGSALKPLWALALMEAGLAPRHRSWLCRGALKDAQGRRHLCWKAGGHGQLSLEAALAQSCNLAALRWGEALGPLEMAKAWRMSGLGFASPHPWPLGASGSLPVAFTLGEAPPTWLSPRRLALWAREWALGGPVWASNGARLRVRQALLAATAPLGTAHAAGGGPWTVAMKTGTAPWGAVPNTLGWAWGYAPAAAPKLAFAVALPGQGSRDAVPFVAKLLRQGAQWAGQKP